MTIPPSTLAIHERRFQAVVVGGLVTVFAIVALSPHTERALFEEGRLPSAFAAIASEPVTPLLRRFGVMAPTTFARAFRTGRPVGAAPATQTRLPGLIPPAVAQPPAFFAQPDDSTPPLVADSGVLGPQNSVPGLQLASFTPGPGTGVIGTGVGPGDTPEPVATPGPGPTEAPPTTPPTATPTTTPTATPTGTPTATPTGIPTTTPTATPTVTPTTTPTATPTNVPTPTPVPTTAPTPTPTDPPIVSPIPEPASWLMLLVGMTLVGFTTRRARKRTQAVA